jgi:biotin carboxyl carrier protein
VARVKTDAQPQVTRVGRGRYRVAQDGRSESVYAVVSAEERWAFWNGRVYRAPRVAPTASRPRGAAAGAARSPRTVSISPTTASVSAPMPATVLKVLVAPGVSVKKGDTVVVLEAMKMELPLRAPRDAAVEAVRCREGELVGADQVLIELTS